MNYQNKQVAITGVGNGFIADQLLTALMTAGANVTQLSGDIRDPKTFEQLNYKYDYLFHFGAPSSQVLFKRQTRYCVDVTLNGFMNAIDACKQNGIKLIYPSTGLLSHGESNEYARCKKICEEIAKAENVDSLGLRIFATYGATEGHKRDYASVPYLFIRDMVKGKRPLIYGSGFQTRDFIYIDDVIKSILILTEECNDKVIDVGTGESKKFNDVIRITNKILGTDIKPVYVDKPTNYVNDTNANIEKLVEYYAPTVSLAQGIEKVIKDLQNEKKQANY